MTSAKSALVEMRSLLKMVVILFCVHGGESHWLRSLMGHEEKTASPYISPKDVQGTRDPAALDGPSEAPGVGSSHLERSRRSTYDSQCGLRSVVLQVRDLGLGYDSDETILFKYCSGTCPRIRSNHDLTLVNLLHSGVLPQPVPGDLRHNVPCCRPTHHEDTAFLDNSHRWHKVEKLSAARCSCVG